MQGKQTVTTGSTLPFPASVGLSLVAFLLLVFCLDNISLGQPPYPAMRVAMQGPAAIPIHGMPLQPFQIPPQPSFQPQVTIPGMPIYGHYQPIQFRAPEGVQFAVAVQQTFPERKPAPYLVGLLVGRDYRMRLTNIPFNPGKELYPTVTILERTFPPVGKEWDFPIIVDITLEDLELALDGKYVTRVIYLENPESPTPIRGDLETQLSVDVTPGADPMDIANTLGKPVAILRIGGRVPNWNQVDAAFFLGSPSWVSCPQVLPVAHAPGLLNALSDRNAVVIDPAFKEEGAKIVAGRQEISTAIPQPAWRPKTVVGAWPANEYLVDGGDNGMRVTVNDDWSVKNLGPEDTVAHYDTLDGQVIVEPSNRVHIYAPRFGAVRKVEGVAGNGQITALTDSRNSLSLQIDQRKEKVGYTEQEQNAGFARTRNQLSGVGSRNISAGTSATTGLLGASHSESVEVYINDLTTKNLSNREMLSLMAGRNNARAWQGIEGVKVRFNVLAPMAATSEEGAASFFTVTTEDGKVASKLRLIKVASKDAARPGDIIDFTIRFDNLGNQPIGNVTILDHLTTRLEFLDGSAKSSVKTGFVAEPNQSGSLTIRFEITDPLQPLDFGVVQFKCRVL